MPDSAPEPPVRQPSGPPARKKRLFSGFRSPKYALLTPLFPPKAPENRPFCAHFRAPCFGQLARDCPRPVAAGLPRQPAPKQPVGSRHKAVSSTQIPQSPDHSILHHSQFTIQHFRNHSITRSLNHSILLAFSPRKLYTPSPDDGVVNGPPSSRVTRSPIAHTPRRL